MKKKTKTSDALSIKTIFKKNKNSNLRGLVTEDARSQQTWEPLGHIKSEIAESFVFIKALFMSGSNCTVRRILLLTFSIPLGFPWRLSTVTYINYLNL